MGVSIFMMGNLDVFPSKAWLLDLFSSETGYTMESGEIAEELPSLDEEFRAVPILIERALTGAGTPYAFLAVAVAVHVAEKIVKFVFGGTLGVVCKMCCACCCSKRPAADKKENNPAFVCNQMTFVESKEIWDKEGFLSSYKMLDHPEYKKLGISEKVETKKDASPADSPIKCAN